MSFLQLFASSSQLYFTGWVTATPCYYVVTKYYKTPIVIPVIAVAAAAVAIPTASLLAWNVRVGIQYMALASVSHMLVNATINRTMLFPTKPIIEYIDRVDTVRVSENKWDKVKVQGWTLNLTPEPFAPLAIFLAGGFLARRLIPRPLISEKFVAKYQEIVRF